MNNPLFDGQDLRTTPTYKEQAYALIKDAILFNRFRVGAVYSQDSICKELGISRTPVREALLELQKDGYIAFSRGKGVIVVPVDKESAHNILEARFYGEKLNASLAAQRATDDEIAQIQKSLDQLCAQLDTRDGQHLYRLDHQFHRTIAAATHNKILLNQSAVLLDHYLRFETKSVYNNSIDANIVFQEHVVICEAIKNRLPDKAEQAMERHLTNSYRRTVNQFWEKDSKP